MQNLSEKIDSDRIAALKEGNSFKKDTLSYLRSVIKNAEIDQSTTELSDEQTIQVIQKEIKRRKEAIESYKIAEKPELAENERREIEILAVYLPSQMNEAEIEEFVNKYLQANPADPTQIGRTIGGIAKELQGKADMGLVSSLVRKLTS